MTVAQYPTHSNDVGRLVLVVFFGVTRVRPFASILEPHL